MGRIALPGLVVLLMGPTICAASELRVASMGGIFFAAGDETTQLHPFLLGNPAGLALLPRQNRFDTAFGFDYFDVNGIAGGAPRTAVRRGFGTAASPLADDLPDYQGLVLRPSDTLGFQLSGSFKREEDGSVTFPFPGARGSFDSVEGFFRAAAKGGPVLVGAEARPRSVSGDLTPRDFLTSGTVEGRDLLLTGSLLFAFPTNLPEDAVRVLVGGTATLQSSPGTTEVRGIIDASPTPLFEAVQTFTTESFLNWGPEIYLWTPGGLEALAFGRLARMEVDLEEDGGGMIPDTPKHRAGEFSSKIGILALRKTARPSEAGTVRLGAAAVLLDQAQDELDPSGAAVFRDDSTRLEVLLGGGFERRDDFSAGGQFAYRKDSGEVQDEGAGTVTLRDAEVLTYKAGGEKRLTPLWDFRMGIHLERVVNKGDHDLETDWARYPSGSGFLTTVVTVGAGLHKKGFRLDLMGYAGQEAMTDGAGNFFGTLGGMRFATAFFF